MADFVAGGAGAPPEPVPNVAPVAPAPSAPAPSNAGQQAPAPAPAQAPSELEVLDKELREAGILFGESDWSVKNAKDRLRKFRSNAAKQGHEYAELKKKWSEVEPLVEQLKDDRFRSVVGQAAQSYYDNIDSGSGPASAQPLSVLSSFDPINRRLDQVETALTVQRIDSELDSLASRNFPMNDEMRDEVKSQMLNNRWGTAEQNYMALFGFQFMELRAQEAARAASEAIKQNNQAYTPGPARTVATSSPIDQSGMSEADRVEYRKRRTMEILGG